MTIYLQIAARKRAPATGGVKKPRRYRPGTVALRYVHAASAKSHLISFHFMVLLCYQRPIFGYVRLCFFMESTVPQLNLNLFTFIYFLAVKFASIRRAPSCSLGRCPSRGSSGRFPSFTRYGRCQFDHHMQDRSAICPWVFLSKHL